MGLSFNKKELRSQESGVASAVDGETSAAGGFPDNRQLANPKGSPGIKHLAFRSRKSEVGNRKTQFFISLLVNTEFKIAEFFFKLITDN
ncbi:hypothetical protein DP117_24435 [Brasilonema sp. UFV-L1]|nr:hypothetical protein [Brasilonema sp. UFV-L1]